LALLAAGSITHTPDVGANAAAIEPPRTQRAELAPDEFAYDMRMMHVADTSAVMTPKRFGTKKARWPHCMDLYGPKKDDLSPCVEKRLKQFLQFQLYDKRDHARAVTENDLRTSEEPVEFVLCLRYDDAPQIDVTLDNINQLEQKQPMVGGRVTFKLTHQFVMSGMTAPPHRKFCWFLKCTHPTFKDKLMEYSPGFYCISKSKLKQLETPRRCRGSAAAAAHA